MAPHIFPRQDHTNDYIAASLFAGVIIFIALLCLLCLSRSKRSRAYKKRNTTSFRVRGVVRQTMTESNPSLTSIPSFSCNGPTTSIVLPKESVTRNPYSNGLSDKAAILSQPTPSCSPYTPSLHPLPPTRAISILNPVHPRHGRSSSGFSGYAKYSFPSGLSSRLSSASFVSSSRARRVHQPFESVLTDELALRCGECLTVLRSFDDGWCVVARDTSRYSRASLATGMKNDGDNVDVGLVPTWVFTKPLEGNASVRPFRSTSLNALHSGHDPAFTRNGILSWANFA
ncbi:hypothetical protein HD554DRAFT_795433 [Boletus coccyginus]|nr:hypothetical protein HD554DRAFT_795433 [Boletus coccyginus]